MTNTRALGILVAFLLFPYLNMILMNFRPPSTSDVFAPGYTLRNYLNILPDEDLSYLEILWDTLLLGAFVTAICLFLGVPVAYHLACSRSRFTTILYALT